MDLKQFTNLVSIQASGNEFADLEWLFTLSESSQKKLKWLNIWGNKIERVDFARLLNDFPNLESVNLENNPLSLSDLDQLDNQLFFKLVELIEAKKIKINAWKGTSLLDLLKYIKQLKEENFELKRQTQAQIQLLPK